MIYLGITRPKLYNGWTEERRRILRVYKNLSLKSEEEREILQEEDSTGTT